LRGARADLDAAPAQLTGRKLGKPGRNLGHDARGRLDEDPADSGDATTRIEIEQIGDEVL
jgi:hypothetical protein